MFIKEIHTEIDIEAKPDVVWNVLEDLSSYPEWNPMVREASGEVRTGNRLSLRYQPDGQKSRIFKPLLIVVIPGCELRWQGQPGFRFLFESEHIYLLKETQNGKTHLDHDMVFWGLFIPPVKKLIDKTVRGPFNDFNKALKHRAEGRYS
ncbi:MAG: SRPBCC domain-containing protein [Syntrophaceae bacterium]|nr:SRPBCC domain-containing protein [Syntrophaceae bacterium]